MLEVLIIVLMVTIFIALRLTIPRFLVGRAIKPVIFLFRQHGAVDPQNAKSAGALGISTKNFAQRMFAPRDYRPKALEALMASDIVVLTEDGRLYLSEEQLAKTPMGQELAEKHSIRQNSQDL